MMDPHDKDEDRQCANLELFVAINYGLKNKETKEDKIVEKVKECLCNGADINAINYNNDGNTALHVAVRRHCNYVIQFLLEHGSKVNIENGQGLTALTLAQKLKCDHKVINLLENCAKLIINEFSINYSSKNQPIWSKLRNNSEIAVLEVTSVELGPDFLQQVEFYDAIDTAGNLFFVDVMVSHMDDIDEDFIKSQLNRLNKQLIIQCGSILNTKVYFKSCEGDVIVIDLNSPAEHFDEKILTEKLSRKESFGIGLIVNALKLEFVGKFESDKRSLLKIRFDVEKHFKGLKLIDFAVRNGDIISVRFLSLNPWNLSKLNHLKTSTLSLAAQHGNVDVLAAVLKVNFPIQFDTICLPEETAVHFNKYKTQMLLTAVRAENFDVIRFLIGCGVELDEDAIELAWDNKQYDVVLFLLKGDCVFPSDFDLDEVDRNDVSVEELIMFVEERDCLHRLIKMGNLISVKEFIKSISSSKLYLNKNNNSAVYTALTSKHLNIFVWLKSELKAEFRDEFERKSVGVGVADSATDALVPHFIPIENAHVLQLVARSRCHQHYAGFKEHIESIYTELNNIPQIAIVFKVIQFCDQIDIIYDFDKDSIVDVNIASSESDRGLCEYKAGRIYIGAKVGKHELLGTIAHELTHLAMQTIYDNDCKPYKLGDPMKDKFYEVIKELSNKCGPVDSIIRRVFVSYGENCWPSELIVRVNQMLAKYDSQDGLRRLEVQAKSLLTYYQEYVTPCCERIVRENHLIKPRNIIRVLNDIAGIMCRIDELTIMLTDCINLGEVFCDGEVQIAVVSTTSPLLSTVSVYQSLSEISQEPNSFLILNFASYVKQRININQAFYSDVCKYLVLLCESVPEKSSLCQSLKGLARVLWAKSDKKIIFIVENSELLEETVNDLPNLPFVVCNDPEYTLQDLTVESAKLLLDQSVSLQCRDANIKLSSLIDEEHFELVDAQTLLKLINKQPIVIGKQIITPSNYDEHLYIRRSLHHPIVINEEVLRDDLDESTVYAISEIDEMTLASLIQRRQSICTFDCISIGHVVKHIIVDSSNGAQQYQQLCQLFPRHNILLLKKVDSGFHLLRSRCVTGDVPPWQNFADADPFYAYKEDELVDQIDEHRVIIVSDMAGMGKTTALTSLIHQMNMRYPYLWVIRLNLDDYTGILDEEQQKENYETVQPNMALDFLVNTLLGSKVESRLETEFERNLLLHFLQHNEDRVVVMFDSFDEIKARHQSIIQVVLVALKSSKVKQLWVTTRPHMRETLENTVHHLSYTLQPFHETHQVNFLERYWRHSLNLDVKLDSASAPGKLHCFSEALIELLSKSISDREKLFTGVPLQMRMLAEAFEKDMKEFYLSNQTQPNLPSKLHLNNLFCMFFNGKYTIFQSEKNRSDSSKPNVEAQNDVLMNYFFNMHRIASVFTLFSAMGSEMLLSKDELSSGASFIRDIASNKLNTGLIDLIIDGKPRFIHVTFAEYLAAEFIVNLIAKGQLSIQVIEFIMTNIFYLEYFKVVRVFIDSHLGEKRITDDVLIKHGKIMRSVCFGKKVFPKLRRFRFNSRIKALPDGRKNFLHVAAYEGNANIANFVLTCLGDCHARDKLIKRVDADRFQALHLAAVHGYLDVVKVLIQHKADVSAPVVNNNQNYDRYSPLLLAASNGHKEVCEWLISRGADTNAMVNNGIYKGHNALHLAVVHGNLDLVKILGQCKDIDFNAEVKDFFGFVGLNALHIAAYKYHWNLVKWIISEGLTDINATFSDCINCRQTVLFLAVKYGYLEIVQWLIDHNADVNNACGCDKNTVLHVAAMADKLPIVGALVNNGANVNAVDCYGQTPLHLAAKLNNVQLVKFLLEVEGIDVNVVDKQGRTPLHLAAITNETKVVKMLVNSGADVNAVDGHGRTPLDRFKV